MRPPKTPAWIDLGELSYSYESAEVERQVRAGTLSGETTLLQYPWAEHGQIRGRAVARTAAEIRRDQ